MSALRAQPIAALTIGLFACASSPQKDTTPASEGRATEHSAGEAESGETESSDETARTGGAEGKPSDAGEYAINEAEKSSRPAQAKLQATDTEAAVRFFVVDKDKGPIEGIVIALTAPSGQRYYTGETDAEGFAEVLVPIAQTYEVLYLSLGRRNVAAKVTVADTPRLNLKLTMRYKREEIPTGEPFVLGEVQFETGSATLTADSYARLKELIEYLTHKPSVRIEISGHTDNVGKKKSNKQLSQQRAEAVRDYLVSKGVDAGRLQAVGYGDEKPIAPNNTPEGRQKNRRIEAKEL